MQRHVPLLLLLSACTQEAPYQELYDQGIDRYMGVFQPTATSEADGVVQNDFDPAQEDGPSAPMCYDGSPFRVMTQDRGSDNVVIFLQGGGLCTSELCLAIPTAPPGIPPLDITDPDLQANPVRDWNVVYVPYCDGSLFAGDADIDDDGDGAPDRQQHGLANLSAALDVAINAFPRATRLLFSGSSGGGYGTIVGTPLVRRAWPDAELSVMNDSGVGVVKDGDPGFLTRLIDELNAGSVLPTSCTDCLTGGHLMPVVGWQLDQDPTLRVGMYSSYEDFVITQMFLAIPQADFRAPLVRETDKLLKAFPDRYGRFLNNGAQHGSLIGDISGVLGDVPPEFEMFSSFITIGGLEDTKAGDVTMGAWLGSFLDDKDWQSVTE